MGLTLAKHQKCQLLTGDKALRKIADSLNVEVHGTIWLVEQMIIQKKITVEAAKVSFQRMQTSGSRLPWNKIDNLLFSKSNDSSILCQA